MAIAPRVGVWPVRSVPEVTRSATDRAASTPTAGESLLLEQFRVRVPEPAVTVADRCHAVSHWNSSLKSSKQVAHTHRYSSGVA